VNDLTADDVLDALDALVEAVNLSIGQVDLVVRRAGVVHHERARGATYVEILSNSGGPLVPEPVTTMLMALLDAGSRLRRAEAKALYVEGLSMGNIARLFGVSRQRVSALLRTPAHGGPDTQIRRERRQALGLVLTDPVFRMIAESIPHIVFVATADGSTEYFNGQGTAYTGSQRETNDGPNWLSLLHPDEAERARAHWRQATRTETPFVLDDRIRRFDGEFRWHAIRALPVPQPDGHVTRWIGTATEIEDHKRLEAELRRAEQATAEALSLLEAARTSTRRTRPEGEQDG
jgi:PAS domain S-box-containing protein